MASNGLGRQMEINALQINYADHKATQFNKAMDIYYQYKIFMSDDAVNWKLVVDKSKNAKDVPHDYIELEKPASARYLKLENIQMPTGKFAISGFRVFGKGSGQKPNAVQNFVPLRAEAKKKGERRSVWFKWQQEQNADGYVIYFGKSPDKLYGSIMVYGKTEYYFNGLDRSDAYYFQIEAFNENGIGERGPIIESKIIESKSSL